MHAASHALLVLPGGNWQGTWQVHTAAGETVNINIAAINELLGYVFKAAAAIKPSGDTRKQGCQGC
jgi:hypothetical protein